MRNEPKRVTRYPILLSSTRQNKDVASNFFEVWRDEKYQEDLVYCQASRKIVKRQKRHNSNLVRHLKMFNQCNAALGAGGHAPRQTVSNSERDGESTGSKYEVATSDADEASAATASACETEHETDSTSTTASISPTPLPEVVPDSIGEHVPLRFLIRRRSPSNYQIEASPSDANLAASRNTQKEQTPTSPVLPSPLLEAVPLQAALLPTHSRVNPQYDLDSEDEEPQVQQAQTDADPLSVNSDRENSEANGGQMGGGRSKRTQFKEIACRSVFHNAMFCKTFESVDLDADLNTLLFSFRDVIKRELSRILALHPGVKAWISLTNLYDYKNQGINRELSIKTPPLYLGSEAGIGPFIVRAEKFIIGRNSSFTVWSSDLDYVRNVNITLTVVEWDMRASGGPTKAIK